MRPVDVDQLATVLRRRRWFDPVRPADLVVAIRIGLDDDELPAIVVDEEPIAISYDEPRCPACALPGDCLRFPHALTGLRPQAAKLAVAAPTVDAVADDDRRRDDRVQPVGLDLAVALALPEHRRGGFRLVEREHQRSVVEGREEQLRAALHRHRHRHRGADFVGLLPIRLAGDRIERRNGPRIPDDELPRAARRDDDRLGDAEIRIGRERPPDLPAGHLVERHHLRVRPSADQADEAAAVDDRRAGKSPVEGPLQSIGAVIRHVVFLPDDVAIRDVQAEQFAVSAGDVNAIAVNRWRGARSDRPRDAAVVDRPLPGPQNLSGLLVQRHRALGAARALRFDVVEDEDPSIGNGGPRIAGPDRRAPQDLQTAFRELVEDSGFVPLAEAALATDFGPVVRPRDGHGHRHEDRGPEGGPHGHQRRHQTSHSSSYLPSTEKASRTLPGIPLAAYPDSTTTIPPAIAGPGPFRDPPRAGTSLTVL